MSLDNAAALSMPVRLMVSVRPLSAARGISARLRGRTMAMIYLKYEITFEV